MYSFDIFQKINSHTTLLTPNRRLSATLHKHYQQYQLDQGKKYWQTPDILPITSWIQRLFSDVTAKKLASASLVLNARQEQFLWEKILLKAKESDTLLQVSETADITRSAWSLLKQWQVDTNHPIFKSAEDYAALHHWATEFQTMCEQHNWIDIATLPELIMSEIKAGNLIPPKNIILIGFTELSPQLKQLLSCCKSLGSEVNEMELSQSKTECARISLIDQENEIVTIARWAKTLFKQNNNVTIGCVIPTLDKKRDRVLQVFSEVFADENTYSVDSQKCAFNISAGKSLPQYPIVNTALQLLGLHKKTISAEIANSLLISPFLGEAEIERIKRANLDSLLRQGNIISIDLCAITKITDNKFSLPKNCPLLAKRLQQFFSLLEEHQSPEMAIKSYHEWAKFFNQLLSILGWPGERSLSSEEYQIVENWLELLSEFSTLDQVGSPVKYQSALHTLQKIAAKTVFQPKTPEAPIQVLGVLEAASLPFDYLWVAGMDDISWPPQPKPNPFIPKLLQRELNMPHATGERELMFCEIVTRQFKQSATHVIFSHAEKNEALELQASPLIRDLPSIDVDMLNLDFYQPPSARIFSTKEIEKILDETAPPHKSDEKIRGGVNVIKQQAWCPFKAFSEWRLHAHELEKPFPGLRSKDRGTIIHKTLELLWNKLEDHATLVNMEESELYLLIQRCIDDALSLFPNSRSDYKHYIALEKQRVHKLIQDWLQIEKARTPFKVMTSEKAAEISLNQLNLTIRIDRIDELPDGKKLIIDYKTGKNNEINSWFSDRPEEPQLPLYTLLDPDNTTGITFAQIAAGEHCFKGVSRYSLEIKGIKLVSEIKKTTALSWEEQLSQWNTTLTKLSDDFYQGIAKVDPKEPTTTCLWCALKPLCRINEEINE